MSRMQQQPLTLQLLHSQNNVTAQRVQNRPLFGYLKRKRVELHQEGPYVKKPPNAFMIFMKEQRPQYADQISTSGSAVVNSLLEQKHLLRERSANPAKRLCVASVLVEAPPTNTRDGAIQPADHPDTES